MAGVKICWGAKMLGSQNVWGTTILGGQTFLGVNFLGLNIFLGTKKMGGYIFLGGQHFLGSKIYWGQAHTTHLWVSRRRTQRLEAKASDICAEKFPLVTKGGWVEGLACADLRARTPIGASRNLSHTVSFYLSYTYSWYNFLFFLSFLL